MGAYLLNPLVDLVRSFLRSLPVEAIVWATALVALAIHHPGSGTHFVLCPLSHFGFDFCPGCGLGRSISFVFHGDFPAAYHAHPLGIFAVIILLYRIVTLTLLHLKLYGKNH